MKKTDPIGIFDSGLGGLTVFKEVAARLSGENIIYLGDTKHVPYGAKSKAAVTRLSTLNIEHLLKKNVKLVVVACNTSSALSLPVLDKIFSVPMIGVVMPGARAGAGLTKTGRIGVIGTKGTIESGAYTKAIKKIKPGIKVFSKPCPLFVPLVEEGWWDNEVSKVVCRKYLSEFKAKKIDTLVLGCTHYPFLKKAISAVLSGIKLIDSATETAKTVEEALLKMDMLNTSGKRPLHSFYVTDSPEKFIKLGSMMLKKRIKKAGLINIE
jgi:glutamate racemase